LPCHRVVTQVTFAGEPVLRGIKPFVPLSLAWAFPLEANRATQVKVSLSTESDNSITWLLSLSPSAAASAAAASSSLPPWPVICQGGLTEVRIVSFVVNMARFFTTVLLVVRHAHNASCMHHQVIQLDTINGPLS
jgi:hypothetical protein